MDRRIVTKTAAQAREEMEKQRLDTSDICPECGTKVLMALTGTEQEGNFLFGQTVRYTYYTCSKCGCEWKVEEGRW